MSEIQKTADAASKGDFTQTINLREQSGFLAILSERLNQMLTANQQMIEEQMRVFAALASGDLTQSMTREYAGSLEHLKKDVNLTVSQLTQVINTVRRNGSQYGRNDRHRAAKCGQCTTGKAIGGQCPRSETRSIASLQGEKS